MDKFYITVGKIVVAMVIADLVVDQESKIMARGKKLATGVKEVAGKSKEGIKNLFNRVKDRAKDLRGTKKDDKNTEEAVIIQ